MNNVRRHYDTLLSEHYTWMSGLPLGEKVDEQERLLERLGVGGGAAGLAVDLGCGPGYQALALANLGFAPVVAIDTSRTLLAELAAADRTHRIDPRLADLRELRSLIEVGTAQAIVCMGDTLTHLDRRSDVSTLFADVYAALAEGGRFVISYRDLSTPLVGLDRIIPVRSDESRIMTCLLDYEADGVTVTDIVYVRQGSGWQLHRSSYRKLRLPIEPVLDQLREVGFAIDFCEAGGRMCVVAATKR